MTIKIAFQFNEIDSQEVKNNIFRIMVEFGGRWRGGGVSPKPYLDESEIGFYYIDKNKIITYDNFGVEAHDGYRYIKVYEQTDESITQILKEFLAPIKLCKLEDDL